MPVCRRVVRREFGALMVKLHGRDRGGRRRGFGTLMVMLHGRDRGGHRRRCRHGSGGEGEGGNGGGGE